MGQKGNPLVGKVNTSIPWKRNFIGDTQYRLNFMKTNMLHNAINFLIFNNLSYSFDFFRFKKTLYNTVDRFSCLSTKSTNSSKGIFTSQLDIIQTEHAIYVHVTILKLTKAKKQAFLYDTALRLKFFYTDTLNFSHRF